MSHRSFASDYDMGITSEQRIKESLESYFDDAFEKLPPKHTMDYQGGKRWLEVKTRTFECNKYPTTMIPCNKITFAKNADKPTSFVFVFTDGCYAIDYNPETFATYQCAPFLRARRIDHTDVVKDHCYIPISDLRKVF